MVYFSDDALKLHQITKDYLNLGQRDLINKHDLRVKWGDSVLESLLTKVYKMGQDSVRKADKRGPK